MSQPTLTEVGSPQNPASTPYPTDVHIPAVEAAGWVTTDGWGMPADLPLPVAAPGQNGRFLPATATPGPLRGYDPWTWAIPQKIDDASIPEIGPYGEPSAMGKGGSINADWGGMPYPVRDYQDTTQTVLLAPRLVHDMSGPTGMFYGPQQTAWEANAVTPQTDYWSTIILGSR